VTPSPQGSPYDRLVVADSPAVFFRLTGSCPQDLSGKGARFRYRGKPRPGARPLIAGSPKVVDFDGRTEIGFLDMPSLHFTKAITVEAWVRPDEVPSARGSAWQLVSKRGGAVLFLQGGPRPRFAFALGGGANASRRLGNSIRAVSRTRVAPNAVYYVVGTYDGSNVRLHVNGSLESTIPHSGSLGVAPAGSRRARTGGGIAGRGRGTPTPHFHGSLDAVAIYPRALTPAQIARHYRLGTSGG
jgi:hypothetical protein